MANKFNTWTRLSPTADSYLLQVQSGIEGKLYYGMQCVVFHLSLHLIRWLPKTKNTLSSILCVPFVLLSSVRRTCYENDKTSNVVPNTQLVLPRNAQGVIVPFSNSLWRPTGIIGTNAGTPSATWSTRWIASADRLMVVRIHFNSFLLECQDQLWMTS